MHKHTTAAGEIVVHMHPYDLSKEGSEPRHHDSESEIHFLDVVFQGQYLQTIFFHIETPRTQAVVSEYRIDGVAPYFKTCHASPAPRGPPCIFS